MKQKHVKTCWLILILPALFLLVVAVGCVREKYDESVMQNRCRQYEKAMTEILREGAGVPVRDLRKQFPYARMNQDRGILVVTLPVDFQDEPSVCNKMYQSVDFRVQDEMAIPISRNNDHMIEHSDRFIGMGLDRLLYYFMRAWRSHIDPDSPEIE